MTAGDTPFPFARILVAVDSTPAASAALSYLRSLLCPGATVRMVAVAENPRTLVPLGAWAGAQLQAARDELRLDAEAAIKTARSRLDGCGAKLEEQIIDLCRVGVTLSTRSPKRYRIGRPIWLSSGRVIIEPCCAGWRERYPRRSRGCFTRRS